jgi:hypothetical protein
MAVFVLGELLARFFELRGALDALGLKLPAVVRRDLGDLPLGLRDQRLVAANGEFLRSEILVLFNPPAAASSCRC